MINKTNNKAFIIDVAVPNDNSVCRKRLNKIWEYSDLAVEIKTLWRLTKADIVPVIVGSTGLMHSGFDNDIEKFNLKTMRLDKFQMITPHCPKFFSDSLIYKLLSTNFKTM